MKEFRVTVDENYATGADFIFFEKENLFAFLRTCIDSAPNPDRSIHIECSEIEEEN